MPTMLLQPDHIQRCNAVPNGPTQRGKGLFRTPPAAPRVAWAVVPDVSGTAHPTVESPIVLRVFCDEFQTRAISDDALPNPVTLRFRPHKEKMERMVFFHGQSACHVFFLLRFPKSYPEILQRVPSLFPCCIIFPEQHARRGASRYVANMNFMGCRLSASNQLQLHLPSSTFCGKRY